MATEFDLKPHVQMWRNFTRLFIFGTGAMVVCLILLALFVL